MSSPHRGRAFIIGGGLAGMVVALELQKRGYRACIYEKSERTGGKAGASLVDGVFEEHGYHVFPQWYANTLALIEEVGASADLVSVKKFYYLKRRGASHQDERGVYPEFIEFRQLESVGAYLHNTFSGIVPWYEAALSFYAVVDLCSQSLSRRRFLDRVSVNGFLRSRRYASDDIAKYHQQTVLQASAIPNYELSAMTLKNLVQHWAARPTPLFSIFNGNLQEKFIQPIERAIRNAGVEILLHSKVTHIESDGTRVRGIRVETREGTWCELLGETDVCVIATPLEVTRKFFDGRVFDLEERNSACPPEAQSLGSINYLTSAPMAAFQLYFKHKIPHLPREHVNLYESRYGLSFIDVSQTWQELDTTALSVIAADFESLRGLSEEEVTRRIMEDLAQFIDDIGFEDLDRFHAELNVDVPLFLNTVGAWPFRPGTRTRLENVYIAGDYCQSSADLTTMESAVISARHTAAAILEDAQAPDPAVHPLPLPSPPQILFKLAKWVFLPGAYCLRLGATLLTGKR